MAERKKREEEEQKAREKLEKARKERRCPECYKKVLSTYLATSLDRNAIVICSSMRLTLQFRQCILGMGLQFTSLV